MHVEKEKKKSGGGSSTFCSSKVIKSLAVGDGMPLFKIAVTRLYHGFEWIFGSFKAVLSK